MVDGRRTASKDPTQVLHQTLGGQMTDPQRGAFDSHRLKARADARGQSFTKMRAPAPRNERHCAADARGRRNALPKAP